MRKLKFSLMVVLSLQVVILTSFSSQMVSGTPIEVAEGRYLSLIDNVKFGNVVEHVRYFSELGSRVTHYPGYEKAAEYITEKFKEYGLTDVGYHEFRIPTPIDYGANLTVLLTGEVITIHPCWPNLVSPPTLPRGGIEGQLVYGGYGFLSDLDGKKIEDSIVLMEFNSRWNWLSPANLGAKAVIFIEPEDTTWQEADRKRLQDIPYNFPRFYIGREEAEKLLAQMEKGQVNVRLQSRMIWSNLNAKNVYGYVRGTKYPDSIVLVTSYYDSWSPVASVSPGATDACGVSALLELARLFAENPPAYTVQFVAFSGHYQGITGARYFVRDNLERLLDRTIILQINIDLSTGTNILQFAFSGYPGGGFYPGGYVTDANLGIFKTLIDERADLINGETGGKHPYEKWFLGVGVIDGQSLRGPLAFDSEAIIFMDGPAITLHTSADSRLLRNTPIDTFERLNIENLKPQVELLYGILNDTLNNEGLKDQILKPFAAAPITTKAIWNTKGRVAEFNTTRAWYTPVPDALLYLRTYGKERSYIEGTDENGYFSIFNLPCDSSLRGFYPGHVGQYIPDLDFEPYVVDPETGNLLYAPDKGIRLYFTPPFQAPIDRDVGYVTVFKCGSIFMPMVVDPHFLSIPNVEGAIDRRTTVWSQVTHAPPDSYGFTPGSSGVNVWVIGYPEIGVAPAMAFVPPGEPTSIMVQVIYAERTPLAAIVNATPDEPEGAGFILKAGQQLSLDHFLLRVAEDFYLVNDARIKKLTGAGIAPSEEIAAHKETKSLIDKAREALAKYEYTKYYTYASMAWSEERMTYLSIRGTAEDSIMVIPYFSLILVSFAIVGERLLFGAGGVKRIIALLGCFVAPLTFLWSFHPGFALSQNSVMVVLGTSVLFLSIPMVGIVFTNVLGFLKDLRKKIRGVHYVEVSRLGEGASAMSLGVENMKRHKLRTALTLTTIILVTTAIVGFTSTAPIRITHYTETGVEPPYYGILLTKRVNGYWLGERGAIQRVQAPFYEGLRPGVPIGETLLPVLQTLYGDKAIIAPRAWRLSDSFPSLIRFRVTRADQPYTRPLGFLGVAGFIGLTDWESDILLTPHLVKGRPFLNGEMYVCIIPNLLADRLNITTLPAKIRVSTIELTVVGVVDAKFASMWKDLDGYQFSLPDTSIPGAWEMQYATRLPGEEIIFMPYELLMQNWGGTTSIALYFKDPTEVEKAAEEFFLTFQAVEVYAGLPGVNGAPGRTVLYTRAKAFTVIGWQYQIPVVVLASIVILNAMLGSVYERTKEIFIYASVGLSPIHVSLMFLMESVVHAVAGGFIGYIFAVSLTKTFTILNIPLPSLNYASIYVLTSIAIAIFVTIFSALYPSIKAAKLVTPSLERAWKIPTKPMGDVWAIPLPFAPGREEEVDGIIAYLHEFISGHRGEDAEVFRIQDIHYGEAIREGAPIRSLTTPQTRLEPYERGIIQDTDIIISKVAERWSIELRIRRLQGPRSQWYTSNYELADELRKQLLLWRSLPPPEQEKYIKEINQIRRTPTRKE